MEQDIATQVVGLGGATDFSLGNFFKGRFCCKVRNYFIDRLLNIFMGPYI